MSVTRTDDYIPLRTAVGMGIKQNTIMRLRHKDGTERTTHFTCCNEFWNACVTEPICGSATIWFKIPLSKLDDYTVKLDGIGTPSMF